MKKLLLVLLLFLCSNAPGLETFGIDHRFEYRPGILPNDWILYDCSDLIMEGTRQEVVHRLNWYRERKIRVTHMHQSKPDANGRILVWLTTEVLLEKIKRK